MDKLLINTLLRVFQSPDSRFRQGQGLNAFCAEYNLGLRQGGSWIFTDQDKQEIGRILKGEHGIDPKTTTLNSWSQLGRSQSLELAHDEKLSGQPVGIGRLRLKALPGRALQIAGGNWNLQVRADLGLDLEAVLDSRIGHDALLVVENLQTFDDVHEVGTDIMGVLSGRDPLVLYRGDAQGGARTDAVHALIERTALPVYAFVDFDPAGLIIASGLPRLDQVLSPELLKLEALIRMSGITQRYLEQVAAANHALERLESDPRIGPLWETIRRVGKALPQEYFHRQSTQNMRRSI